MRAEQIASFVRLTPIMATGSVACASVASLLVWSETGNAVVLGWLVVLVAMFSTAFRAWYRRRNLPPARSVSARALRHAVVNGVALGAIWGALPVIADVPYRGTPQYIVSSVIAGIVAGGGFAMAPVPQVAVAFTIPVIVGSLISLLKAPTFAEWALAFLLLVYVPVILGSSLTHARVFIANLGAEFEAIQQKQVVSMLLKGFEENASDWLWQVDSKGRFLHISSRFAEITGMPAERLEGTSALALLRMISGRSTAFLEIFLSFKSAIPFRDVEIRFDRKGETRWWKVTGAPIYDDVGRFCGFHGVCSDVTEAKIAASRVAYLAHHDGLTGTLSRARFNEELTEAVIAFEFNGVSFALLYLDLDRFKAVNDTMGHQVGDVLLVDAVKRLEALLPPGCLIGRLGGDEFCILYEGACEHEELAALSRSIIEALRTPFEIDGKIARVGTSIGIALANSGAGTAEALLLQADLALYAAKQAGRGTYRFFTADMESAQRELHQLEADLTYAVSHQELVLHFQPIVRSKDGHIAGFEALVRWRHPTKGMISPLDFVPLAEKKGLIGEISCFVLNEACRVAASWPSHYTVSVNLSSRQFSTNRVMSDVRSALESSGLPAHQLELELTESILIEQPEAVIETLNALKAMGVQIALDDFGTGYSSLSYLWRFPFDKIKIDGSFVAAINRDAGARHILNSIGALAHNLGFKLTAERVETLEEVTFLQSIACDFLQGFYFSKPLPESELAPCLAREALAHIPEAKPRERWRKVDTPSKVDTPGKVDTPRKLDTPRKSLKGAFF